MPAATTHVEFAKDVLRTMPLLKKDVTNSHMFWLGSQGPDMLFFSHASVMPGSLHKYGNLLHENKVYEVLSYFEKYAEGDGDLHSYLMGYICHYALDSTMHPLIYGRTSVVHQQNDEAEGVIHVAMESEIDVWTLNQRGKTVNDYNVFKYLGVDKESRFKLAEMYHCMFRNIFGIEIPASKIRHDIIEVDVWTKWIRPRKTTHDLIYAGESLAGGNHGLTAMMLYDTQVGPIINLDHHAYTVPWAPHNTVCASVPELYGAAVLKAQRLLKHHEKKDFILDFKGEPNQKQNMED
jgi:hypothetical protein